MIRCKYLLYNFLAISMSGLLAACNSGATETRTPAKQDGQVVFFDDFTTGSLDRTKWNVEVTGMHGNNELQAYVDSSATISFVSGKNAEGAENGALLLRPIHTPNFVTTDGKKFDFISGRINTKSKSEFTYGTISARIKLTDGAGLWPAWGMLGSGTWPETGEIDIMEYAGEKDWASAAVHGKGYSGDAGIVDRVYFPDSSNVTQWHIYSVDWSPESLVFKYDGITILRVTKPMTQFFGEWAFNNPKFLILNFAVGGVYPFKINGIKEPYHGLSSSALAAIKDGKSKMLVDWVKVTKNEID